MDQVIMTPEKQRIAIAEACGWKWVGSPEQVAATYGFTMPEKWVVDSNGKLQFPHNTPDYLNDLNAMHEAEEILTDQQHNRFRKHLAHVVGERESPSYSTPGWRRRYVSATARQRAEAFLKTIGKWEDSQ
jgi:hypothetical protein